MGTVWSWQAVKFYCPIKVLKGHCGRALSAVGSEMKGQPQAIRAFVLDYPREKAEEPEDTL